MLLDRYKHALAKLQRDIANELVSTRHASMEEVEYKRGMAYGLDMAFAEYESLLKQVMEEERNQ